MQEHIALQQYALQGKVRSMTQPASPVKPVLLAGLKMVEHGATACCVVAFPASRPPCLGGRI
jgi:hypothetical protein